MSANKERIKSKYGTTPVGGPVIRQSENELYPAGFVNDLNGGQHGYQSLEQLAHIPVDMLEVPMTALIAEHTLGNGTVVPTTMYELYRLPDPGYDTIAQIPAPDNDISRYWRVFKPVAEFIGTRQTQYAPNADTLTGQATSDGSGSQPPFPGSARGVAITHQQYSDLIEGQNVLINGVAVAGYWAPEFDATKGHKWMRQDAGNGKWGIPVLISGEGYEKGDYIENRFTWYKPATVSSPATPGTPPMYVNGQLNNEPAGTTDKPLPNPNDGAKLFRTKAQKNVFMQLKTEWMPFVEVPYNPLLVRYSPTGTPDPNSVPYADLDSLEWVPTYDHATHKYIATRSADSQPWVVDQIEKESGEYTEYIFKVFDADQMDQLRDTPSLFRPERKANPAGWSDTPQPLGPGQSHAVSVARKYFNGELIGQWSDPYPFSGEDALIDIIRSSGGDEFKYGKDGTVTPGSLTLTPYLYKGVQLVAADSVTWERIFDLELPNAVIAKNPDGKSITITPTQVTGKAIFKCTQTYGTLTLVQEYSILDIADGKDAKLLQLTSDVPILTRKADTSIQPATATLRALSANLSDEGALKWEMKKQGASEWTRIKNADTTDYTSPEDVLAVNYADFNGINEISYRAVSVDGISDTMTIYLVAEASNGAPGITMVLSNESHNVIWDEATNTVNLATAFSDIKVYSGATDETGLWTIQIVDSAGIVSTLGVVGQARVSEVSNQPLPRVKITSISANTTAAYVTVKATKGSNTVQKHFSIAKIKDPVGAVQLDVDSDNNGLVFTPGNQTAKTLKANLYVNSALVTAGLEYKWYLENDFDSNGNLVVKSTGDTLQVLASQVDLALTVICEVVYKTKTYKRIITLTDVPDARALGILYTKAQALVANQYPNNSWAYNSAGGTVNSVAWSKDATDAIFWSLRRDGEASWSVPVRIRGEKGQQGDAGNSMRNIFTWANARPATPEANATAGSNWIPNGWTDAPAVQPADTKFLWSCWGEIRPDNTVKGTWSTPLQVNGTNGLAGVDGKAATISIHSVVTGAPGSAANVENMGTASAAALKFTIPQGPPGTNLPPIIQDTRAVTELTLDATLKELLKLPTLPKAWVSGDPVTECPGMLICTIDAKSDGGTDWPILYLEHYANDIWDQTMRWMPLSEARGYVGETSWTQVHLVYYGTFSNGLLAPQLRMAAKNTAGGSVKYRNPRFIFIPFA